MLRLVQEEDKQQLKTNFPEKILKKILKENRNWKPSNSAASELRLADEEDRICFPG